MASPRVQLPQLPESVPAFNYAEALPKTDDHIPQTITSKYDNNLINLSAQHGHNLKKEIESEANDEHFMELENRIADFLDGEDVFVMSCDDRQTLTASTKIQ